MEQANLKCILMTEKPSILIRENEKMIFEDIPELEKCKGFEQNNIWHPYDVYEHTLHVVDNTDADYILRMAALFHDLGKPSTYVSDQAGVGHFPEHYKVSKTIFDKYAKDKKMDEYKSFTISNLIYYHDINLDKIDEDTLYLLVDLFNFRNILRLFQLKRADLLAQNKEFHESKLADYDRQELWFSDNYEDLREKSLLRRKNR